MDDLNAILSRSIINTRSPYHHKNGLGNFTQISNRILKDGSLSVYEKMTIIILKMYMMNKKMCWPSQATISRHVGCGKSTIKKVLKSLEAKAYIKRSDEINVRSTTYKINI